MPTHNFKRTLMSFAGQPITGFMKGTGVKVERNEDNFTLVVGSDGEFARSRTNNKGGTITFTLMHTSKSNDILSVAANADELSGTGAAPFFLKDLDSATTAVAAEAWVKKTAAIERGDEIVGTEWVLETGELEMFLGGKRT